MRANLVGLLLLTAGAASAQDRTVEGMGRVAVLGGYRWAPNEPFRNRAAELETPVVGKMPGGPQFSASFGYAPTDWIEASIDVFGGFESFSMTKYDDFTSVTYGALLGARLEKMDFPVRGLLPYLGVQIGPTLSFVTGKIKGNVEKLNTGISINAGLTFRIADKWGIGFDVRYLFASGGVPDMNYASLNAGGLWGSLSITYFIGAGPKDPMNGM